MGMEISITKGSYKWTATLVEPTQPSPYLCREFFNVGLETEAEGNHYVASKEHVIATTVELACTS